MVPLPEFHFLKAVELTVSSMKMVIVYMYLFILLGIIILGGEKIEKGEWKIVPISIISLILEGSPEEDLSILANSLKQEIIDKAHPIEN